jgi:hypothetical protein
MRKRIKLEQREKTVHDADRRPEEAFKSDEEDEEEIGEEDNEDGQEEIVDENKLQPGEIK